MKTYAIGRPDPDGFMAVRVAGHLSFYVRRWEERRDVRKVTLKDLDFRQSPDVRWVTVFQICNLDKQPIGEPGERLKELVEAYLNPNP